MQIPIGECQRALSLSHCRLLVRQGRGGPSVLRRPAHRLLRRHRPQMPSASVPQRFRSRHLCVAAEKGMRCGAPMFSRPTCGSTLSRSAAGLTRRSSGAPTSGRATAPRYSCFRAAGCRRPLNSTLGHANTSRRMSERLVVLHFSTADCLSGKAEAGRPSFGGRRTVCCFGTALKCRVCQRCSASGRVLCAWPLRNVRAVAFSCSRGQLAAVHFPGQQPA